MIEFVRVIEENAGESPCLMEAVGLTTYEDVVGIVGYLDFLDIINDNHLDFAMMKSWAGYWSPESSEWASGRGLWIFKINLL